jgi:hypothetical protein
MTEFVCYCLKYTAADIERDVRENGRSTIIETITAESHAGKCNCKTNNPKHR